MTSWNLTKSLTFTIINTSISDSRGSAYMIFKKFDISENTVLIRSSTKCDMFHIRVWQMWRHFHAPVPFYKAKKPLATNELSHKIAEITGRRWTGKALKADKKATIAILNTRTHPEGISYILLHEKIEGKTKTSSLPLRFLHSIRILKIKPRKEKFMFSNPLSFIIEISHCYTQIIIITIIIMIIITIIITIIIVVVIIIVSAIVTIIIITTNFISSW